MVEISEMMVIAAANSMQGKNICLDSVREALQVAIETYNKDKKTIIRDLQVDLLALLKAGYSGCRLATIEYGSPVWHKILELRAQIHQIDPEAALYESHGGPVPRLVHDPRRD